QQLHDDVGGENRPRPERRGAQALENSTLSIDRDDVRQRQHCADRDRHRQQRRYSTGAEQPAKVVRWSYVDAGSSSAGDDEEQDRDKDRPDGAEWLAEEDLDLHPRELRQAPQRVDHSWLKMSRALIRAEFSSDF